MIRVKPELTRIEARDLGLQGSERPGGLFGAFRGLSLSGSEPADLSCSRFATTAQRVDLTVSLASPSRLSAAARMSAASRFSSPRSASSQLLRWMGVL